jgi:hypothetical protein
MTTGMDDLTTAKLMTLQSAELTGSTRFCPEDQEIAEYFDGVLPKEELSRLERHLADCRYCLARVGMLGRLDAHHSDRRIPGDVLATAKAIAPKVPGRRQKWVPAWAAAALVVLAVGVLSQLDSTGQRGPESIPSVKSVEQSGNRRETRSANSTVPGPSFLSPVESPATIPTGYFFRWTPVANSRFYQVRIVSDNGDLLWQERVTGTEWKIPAGTQLIAGAEYFVRVEAFLTDTRSLKSEYLPFQVEGQQ